MGQYYKVIVKDENNERVYNRDLIYSDGETKYTMAKLMEHSWWRNHFVNAVCLEITNNDIPTRIAWIGDYADELFEDGSHVNNLSTEKLKELFYKTWNNEGLPLNDTEFTLQNQYLINHTKKQYVVCNTYYNKSKKLLEHYGTWCIHPLPLLTCIGNGLGGGDYLRPSNDSTVELIGAWAWDEITIEQRKPITYEEILPVFVEGM